MILWTLYLYLTLLFSIVILLLILCNFPAISVVFPKNFVTLQPNMFE